MFENYQIAIKIRVTDEASRAVSLLTRHLLLSEEAAGKLQTRLATIKGFFVGGTALMGTGAALAAPLLYAVDKAAELQKQLIGIQLATRGTSQQMDQMRSVIEKVSGVTVFSSIDIANQAKMIATGTGLNATQVQGVLPAYAKYADVQMLLKGSSYQQSIGDAIKAAHGAGHYDAASLTAYLDKLNKASLVIPGSTSEVVRGLSYFQQVSKNVLGMDDDNSILGIALMNRLGMPGTRGGTNLGAALTRSIPGIFGSGLLKGKSQVALADMGMTDAQGHAKVFTDGKFDITKWMGLTSDFVSREMASHPEDIARQNIMKDFQSAYGTIGSRSASLLGSKQAIEGWQSLSAQFKEYGGFEAMQQHFADKSVSQQWLNAKTNFQNAMVEIGITLLPTASEALKKLNVHLQTLIEWLSKNPEKVKEYATNIGLFAVALTGLGVISIVTAGVQGLVTAFGLLVPAITALGAAARITPAPGFNAFSGVGAAEGAAGKLGKFLKIAKGAAFVGTAIELTDFIANDVFGLDSKLGSLFAPGQNYNPNAKSGGSKGGVTVHVHNKVDRHGLTTMVTDEQSRALGGPQTGVSFGDSRLMAEVAGGLGY